MKPTSALRLLALAAAVSVLNLRAADAPSPREHLSLDAGWKFHLGDDWPGALRLDKAGSSGGPAAEKFGDSAWRGLDLPHDWAIELPFDKNADGSHGFKAVGPGFAKNSIGWYRRTFELPKEDDGKRIWLTFDGVFRDATVWVNGWLIKRHEGGYNPFREDITDVAHFGGKNTLAVRVDATKFEGWFYEGAGIYRHVWLDKTAPVAIAPDGIFVHTEFNDNIPEGPATVCIETRILNRLTNSTDINITHELFDPSGKSLTKSFSMPKRPKSGLETFVPKPQEDFKQKIVMMPMHAPALVGLPGHVPRISPHFHLPKLEYSDGLLVPSAQALADVELWSPENPKLYKLITTIVAEGKIVDRKETLFGIRTVGFDATNGFLLNGKHYELYGTCNHQDMAGVGAALPDALQYFRIAKLKEFGCNAYRTSHNPPTPELLEACDRLGMIVMDESRLLGSDEENLRKWKDQILRDRNHASVGLWSVANEEFSVQDSPQGGNVAKTMQNFVKSLDPTRPVTYAAPEGDTFAGINGVIEVRGWNYHIGQGMDDYHAKHPDQP
ncbi:MAG TPA: glycoside hydrolase family 2 TIM barrel-domain containing protein, partial [Verrucomicrobiae bacterium]